VQTEADQAVAAQKLINLQIDISELLVEKKKKKLSRLTEYLGNKIAVFFEDNSLFREEKLSFHLDSKEEFVRWLNTLNTAINAEVKSLSNKRFYYEVFAQTLKSTLTSLNKTIDKNIGLIEHETSISEKSNRSEDSRKPFQVKKNSHKSFVSVLTDPSLAIPKIKIQKRFWLKENFYSLLNGLIPTALGGFCSLFTYFQGLPDIFKKMGINTFDPLSQSLIAKIISLAVIFAITLYFGAAFLHADKKSYERRREYEKTEKLLANKETDLLTIDAKLNLLKKTRRYLDNIALILVFMRHLSNLDRVSLQEPIRYT
jgi:hypothetical protein